MDTPSPYQPPVAGPSHMPPPPPGVREPTAVKVFGVIHLVFAGLGLLMGLWSIASPFVTPMFIRKTDPNYQMQVNLQHEMMGFSIGSGIAVLVIAALLLISGLKLVRSQPDGVRWSAYYSWTSVVTKLISGVVGVIWILPMTRAIMRGSMEGSKAGPAGEKMLSIMEPVMGASMIVSPIISCTYPLLALFFLSRRPVKEWVAARSQGAL